MFITRETMTDSGPVTVCFTVRTDPFKTTVACPIDDLFDSSTDCLMDYYDDYVCALLLSLLTDLVCWDENQHHDEVVNRFDSTPVSSTPTIKSPFLLEAERES